MALVDFLWGTKDQNYSLNEQLVGKWIDNKPLYRRVLSYQRTFPQDTWNYTIESLASWGIDRIVDIQGKCNDGEPLVNPDFVSRGWVHEFYITSTWDLNINIGYRANFNYIYIIIYYTKTADAATGLPFSSYNKYKSFCYASDEYRIGNWYNGKPLYRRVVQLSGTYSGQNVTIYDLSSWGADRFYRFSGTAYNPLDNAMGCSLITPVYGYIRSIWVNSSYQIEIWNEDGCKFKDPIFILEYTKAADEPEVSVQMSLQNVLFDGSSRNYLDETCTLIPGHDDMYLSSETCVGTWIDGKPLYRRWFLYNSEIPGWWGDWVVCNTGDWGIGEICFTEGWHDQGSFCVEPIGNWEWYYYFSKISDGTLDLRFSIGGNTTAHDPRICIYYTK